MTPPAPPEATGPDERGAEGRRHVPARGAFRPEVQALRALAVALVVLYHLWPHALPGGYVGVDVFFVISGFLITGQLTREIARTGRVRLLGFWARRIRRLLPAAFAVIAVVAVGIWAVVPRNLWQQYFGDLGSSALYAQNWNLIGDAVNYFAADDGASPLQHFWSLSVEEQFYLVWPLLLLVPLLLPLRHRRVRIATGWALAIVTLASLVYGIVLSASDPSVAYLSTFSRAWEFGAGGLLAYLLPGIRLPGSAGAALSWAGLAAIVASAFLLSGATPFPGTAALLPVLGAVAVIVAGLPEVRWGPGAAMTHRGVQWLGDASYSLYLWHWPLIALVPLGIARVTGSPASHRAVVMPVVLAVSLAAAWASKRFIEDPTRRAPFWADRRPRRSFAVMAGGMAVVCAVSMIGWSGVQQQIERNKMRTASLVSAMPTCLGAAAIDSATPQPCSDPGLDGVLIPGVVSVADDLPHTCQVSPRSTELATCTEGVPAADAVKTVALVGDSHAAQWAPALDRIAKAEKWHVVMMLKGSCAFSTAPRISGSSPAATASCAAWNTKVREHLAAMGSLDAVITSADIKDAFAPGGADGYANAVAGYRHTWKGLPASVRDVYVLADTPRPRQDVQKCLSLHSTADLLAGACSRSRDAAIGKDPLVAAARSAGSRVHLIDMTDDFCTAGDCAAAVGHVLVYRDHSHISATYSTTLAPYLKRAIADVS